MITLLPEHDPGAFPDVRQALKQPNGLLAVGGDLSLERLTNAYRRGIFPWFGVGDPILWWSPDPRTVLIPDEVHVSRSLRKRLRRRGYGMTMDRTFERVIRACSAPRDSQSGTWIVPEMIRAYENLHRAGFAHSVEAWEDRRLVGGLYGVAIGRAFFGESMFSRADDASKVALVHLCERLAHWGFGIIDCQMYTAHLASMGAKEMPRRRFTAMLARLCDLDGRDGSWDDGQIHFPSGPAPTASAPGLTAADPTQPEPRQ